MESVILEIKHEGPNKGGAVELKACGHSNRIRYGLTPEGKPQPWDTLSVQDYDAGRQTVFLGGLYRGSYGDVCLSIAEFVEAMDSIDGAVKSDYEFLHPYIAERSQAEKPAGRKKVTTVEHKVIIQASNDNNGINIAPPKSARKTPQSTPLFIEPGTQMSLF